MTESPARIWTATLWALGFFAASASQAQDPVRVGIEFQVNTVTAGSQKNPAAAADADGDVIVVWETIGGTPGISGRRISSAGVPQGVQFGINVAQNGATRPAVGAAPNGSFAVAWATDGGSVRARPFDSSGNALGSEFQINFVTASYGLASVDADANGNFVIVWSSLGDLSGRRFGASGAALGPEFAVSSHTTQSEEFPAVRSEPDGDFVVVWSTYQGLPPGGGQDGSYSGVFGQRFASSGARVGIEFQVNTYTPFYQTQPALEVHADGSFIVVWSSGAQDGAYNGIFAQRFDSSGARSGEEFQVNIGILGDQRYSGVGADADGRFVVAWQSDPKNNDQNGILLRRFASTGASQSLDVRANTQIVDGYHFPALAGANGRFIVAWEAGGDGEGNGIFAQPIRLLAAVDVDGDGSFVPLTDGLLMLRFGFGFTGTTLITGAVGAGCTRCDAPSILAYLKALM